MCKKIKDYYNAPPITKVWTLARNNPVIVDECIAEKIKALAKREIITLSCCCGHGRYPKSIIVLCKDGITKREYYSRKKILRKRKFYKRDEKGYYYIPEVSNAKC